MLTINTNSTEEPPRKEVRAQAREFKKKGFIHLREFLGKELCAGVVKTFRDAEYIERHTENIGCVEACLDKESMSKLNQKLSDAKVLQAINKIYAGSPVDFFMGNTVRRIPGRNHFSNYHNDNNLFAHQIRGASYRRAVALSLNISENSYGGGALSIGDLPPSVQLTEEVPLQLGKEILLDNEVKIKNETPGDALLFAIAPDKFHRVEDVISGGPRTVFVGWFYTRC